jgi:hypothetical protein
MTGIAITPATIAHDAATTARSGVTPAIIGAFGAGLGLYVWTVFLAPASLPMSVLGIVLGLHSRVYGAAIAGALGVVCAIVGLLYTDAFWVLFAAVAGAIGVG